MDQLTLKTVKTRKPHKCWGCAKEYPAGTKMRYSVSVDQGDFYSTYWCKNCETVMGNLEYWQLEDGVEYGALNDSYYDEYREEIMNITKEELSILFHTLGLNYKPDPFRNHFVASKGHSDYSTLESLKEKGLMDYAQKPSFCSDYDILYYVTQKGKEIAISEKKKSIPKLTRSQQRYQDYLHSEVGMTFAEWLGVDK